MSSLTAVPIVGLHLGLFSTTSATADDIDGFLVDILGIFFVCLFFVGGGGCFLFFVFLVSFFWGGVFFCFVFIYLFFLFAAFCYFCFCFFFFFTYVTFYSLAMKWLFLTTDDFVHLFFLFHLFWFGWRFILLLILIFLISSISYDQWVCLATSWRRGLKCIDCIPFKGIRSPHQKRAKLHLMVRLPFWRFRECEVPLYYYYSQCTSDLSMDIIVLVNIY